MGDVGLYAKYIITKADGTPVNDRCFVLKPDKDPAAAKALQAYAAATDDEQLRNNLYAWVGKPTLKPMTLEEVIAFDGEIWMEDKSDFDVWACRCFFNRAEKKMTVHYITMNTEVLEFSTYGKTWRCWSRKPTDEERSAAEWG